MGNENVAATPLSGQRNKTEAKKIDEKAKGAAASLPSAGNQGARACSQRIRVKSNEVKGMCCAALRAVANANAAQ